MNGLTYLTNFSGKREFGRKRAATLAQDAANIEFSEETFDPYNPSKRPPQWTEVRQKRVMLRDHMDRISGFSETRIAEGRALREVDVSSFLINMRRHHHLILIHAHPLLLPR